MQEGEVNFKVESETKSGTERSIQRRTRNSHHGKSKRVTKTIHLKEDPWEKEVIKSESHNKRIKDSKPCDQSLQYF